MTTTNQPKVLLIVPPVDPRYCAIVTTSSLMTTARKFPSLGLGYIAAVLERRGFPVQYIDMFATDMPIASLPSLLRADAPRYAGITTDMATLNTARQVAKALKTLNPGCTVIVGGYNVGLFPKEILACPDFDIGVIGEGEETIVDLLDALERGATLDQVHGIAYKQNGVFHKTLARAPVRDLDTLPFPARHMMPTRKYISSISKRGFLTTVLASRGCPFNCLYCIKDHDFRARSPNNVVDELEHIVKVMGINEAYFCDPTFTANQHRVIGICKEIIRRKLDIVWEAATRVDCVSPTVLRWMKRAGCTRIQYGIESGDPRVLMRLRKRISTLQARNAVGWARENGLEVLASFMFGSPGDTKESMERSIKFAIELDPDYIVFTIATIVPGTEIHDIAKAKGIVDERPWAAYMRGESKVMPNPVFTSEEYDRKYLEKVLKDAYRRFYLRPSFILKRLLKTRSFSELKNNLLGLKIVLIEILTRP